MDVIAIKGLVKVFADRQVLTDISFRVAQGKICGFIGPNGAGKTTLLKLILGTIAPDSGSATMGTRIEVAYFDQMREGLNLNASLEDYISPGSEWIEINGNRKHVKSYLNDFLFAPERAASPVSTLSGGEQQMLAVSRALMGKPTLLMLDEPSMGLAPVLVDMIFETISAIRDQGITILLIEQNASAALEVADRAYVLESGSVKMSGSAKDLRKDDQVTKAYLGGH